MHCFTHTFYYCIPYYKLYAMITSTTTNANDYATILSIQECISSQFLIPWILINLFVRPNESFSHAFYTFAAYFFWGLHFKRLFLFSFLYFFTLHFISFQSHFNHHLFSFCFLFTITWYTINHQKTNVSTFAWFFPFS